MRIPVFLFAFFASLLAVGSAGTAEEKVLNVYNWSDYVAEDTISRFTAETGIKVNYDVYDSNEMLEAKLMAGKSGFDVVFPTSSPFVTRQIQSGIHQMLDRAKLPNWANLNARMLKAISSADPGNKYAVPYMMAGTGFGYNVAKVNEIAPGAPLDSWAMIFDPKWSSKLKACGVTLLDDPTEVYAAAYVYLGLDPASEKSEDFDKATKLIGGIRGNLKYIHSSSYINDLANGDICVAHGYGGDLIQARDRADEAKKDKITVVLPKEGGLANIDVMVIPADAPHPVNAHAFINFMMRADVVGPITEAVGYANAVEGSEKFVSDARRADPVVYPPQEVLKKFAVSPLPSQKFERTRTRTWTRLKTGQ